MSESKVFVPTENRFIGRQFDPNDPPGQQIIDSIMSPYFENPNGGYTSLVVSHTQDILDEVKAAFEGSGRVCTITPWTQSSGRCIVL